LVLCERVPLKFMNNPIPEMDDNDEEFDYPYHILFADLDDNFELRNWNSSTKELTNLSGAGCPDGTIDSIGATYNLVNWGGNPCSILFRK